MLAIKAYGEEIIEKKKKAAERKAHNLSQKQSKAQSKKRKREDEGSSADASKQATTAGESVKREQAAVSNEAVVGEAAVGVSEDVVMTSEISQEEALAELKQKRADELVKLREKLDAVTKALEVPGIAQTPIHKGLLGQQQTYRAAIQRREETPVTLPPPKESPQPKQPKINFTILDALSATGLRALRYSHEIPFTTSVTANDLLPEATKAIELNVQHNQLQDKIKPITGNAMAHMYSLVPDPRKEKHPNNSSKQYDVIDLDPYGTAAPFLDGAVQAVRENGGLLCVTCTDAGVWASNGYPEKAFSLYGGTTIKGMHSHEGGLRLILNSIATAAARHGLSIEPLLSLSIDFYARVFVRIHKSPADVKFLAGKTMVVYNCDVGCGAWTTQMIGRNKLAPNKNNNGHFWKYSYAQGPSSSEHCNHCGFKMHIAGPMWAGPLHSPDFIKKILADLPNVSKDIYQTTARIEGMLTVALEELLPLPENPLSPTSVSKTGRYDPAELDPTPFFFMPGVLAKVLHTITPDENSLRGALRHLGYRVTRSHTKGGSIKTDAPWEVIWEVLREWVKQKSPIKEGALKPGTAGYTIMGLSKGNAAEASPAETALDEKSADATGTQKHDENKTVAETKKIEIVFDAVLGKEKQRRVVRYPENPRENWGPMNRARGGAA